MVFEQTTVQDVRDSVVNLGCVADLTAIAKKDSMATHARVIASDFLHDLSESRPGQVRTLTLGCRRAGWPLRR